MSEPLPNGWNEWSRHVLAELVRLDQCYKEIREDSEKRDKERVKEVVCLKTEMAALQVKAGLWGAVGAAIPIIGYLLLNK